MEDPAKALDLPNHAYYRANHGRWRGPFHFTITDRAAFRAARIGLLDRLRAWSMSIAPAIVGPLVLETTVDYETGGARGEVVHTSRISKWGIAVYVAREVFSLHPDGTGVSVTRHERIFPSFFSKREEVTRSATVDASGKSASYVYSLFGVELRQRGVIEEAGVRITQETDFSRAEQLLVRVS